MKEKTAPRRAWRKVERDVSPPTSHLSRPTARPNPAASYAEALARVAAIQAQETAGYNPLCRTQLLTHGHKTGRAIAFIHGYTNCPNQFLKLGRQCHHLGDNVLLMPMPYHGLADPMTVELSRLSAERMAAYADLLVDIARGLGDQVTLAGQSQGGVVAGWAAQTRSDLDQAVLISPAFGLKIIPTPLTRLVVRVVLALPDRHLWWHTLVRSPFSPPPSLASADEVQGYPRFSMHGLAQILRLAAAVRSLARTTAPAARSILLVTNAADRAVENAVAALVLADWRAHAANVNAYEFPLRLRLDHDLIDPANPRQRVDLVYPKLIELMRAPASAD